MWITKTVIFLKHAAVAAITD